VSCGNKTTSVDPEPNEPATPTGSLEVTVTTNGESPDKDGYELSIGGNSETVGADEIKTFDELEEGTYQLELNGVASNCSVDSANPQEISITADATTTASIQVVCKLVLNNKIVFGSKRNGNFDIYTIDDDGNNIRQITDNSAYDGNPKISNAGTQIVFESERNTDATDLFIMDANGSDIRQITSSSSYTYNGSWSPNDSLLAFNDSRTGSGEIYTIRTDGSEKVQLTNDPSFVYSGTSWTPDGEEIVYSRVDGGISEIFIMNSDGTNPQPLTDYSSYSSVPVVSPDGSKIAFRSNRDGNFKIYTMNIDGSDLKLITDHDSNNLYPSWSPDGSEISFEATRDGNDEVYKISVDGSGGAINLTNNPADDEMPYWSPIGDS
jgi:Tol biopolymer transport system component